MANAEILGVLASIHAAVPEAMAGAGVITGILDMGSASASFASPEAVLQDAGIAQLYDEYYRQDLAIGTGYTDAKYPGVQAMLEKTYKMSAAAMQGRFNFPVGLLAGGKRFCPEQSVLDLEIAVMLKKQYADINADEEQIAEDVINAVGIGGEFLSHSHTLEHFGKNMWRPSILDRTAPSTLEREKNVDMLDRAGEQVRKIWSRNDLYVIDEHKAREIDKIVKKAEKLLN
jgi:trimethylamine--corrinoid protein Co-methyltransferase